VYDLIPINTELEWLEIRLNELDDQVDYFVILESMQTFTGHAKPLIFKENYACFAKFHHKIIYHALDMTEGNFHDEWSRESYSRNALLTHVFPSLLPPQAPSTKDVLIIADIDEIPRPETLEVLRNCEFPQRTTLRSRFFYYSYQWQHRGKEWEHPQATYFLGSETVMPQDLRKRRGGTYWDFWNSSWHCSSCFATVAEMDYKIASFSHKEFNRAEFRDPDGIVRRVRNGLDLFDRWGENYERVDPVTDVPHWLMEDENKSRFEFLLSRDSDNAGFRDYP
jgi:beta-1,4-mannosyl-glycoprotein beta-1,4-N-acetylglucosaminyltransferase